MWQCVWILQNALWVNMFLLYCLFFMHRLINISQPSKQQVGIPTNTANKPRWVIYSSHLRGLLFSKTVTFLFKSRRAFPRLQWSKSLRPGFKKRLCQSETFPKQTPRRCEVVCRCENAHAQDTWLWGLLSKTIFCGKFPNGSTSPHMRESSSTGGKSSTDLV